MSEKRYIGWLLGGMLMLLLLTACSEESDEPQGSPLRLSTVTRTGDDHPDHLTTGSIKMFVMTPGAQFSSGTFSYGSGWSGTGVSVGEHGQYYIYGYSPSTIAGSLATPTGGGDYADGADLTLTNMPMFPSDDICVIVGVQKVSTAESADSHTAVNEGHYGYLSGLNSENYVNLLVDHLYSQLILQFNVDADYYALRHIKLKTVTLKSTYGQTVNATIKLRDGDDNGLNNNTVGFSQHTAGYVELPVWTEASAVFLTTETMSVTATPITCAPCTFDANGTNLELTCTYDVYNTSETKVLRSQEVTNKLKVTNMAPGVKKTVTLTIEPTYLYVLSDDDLDNPTIVVNSD